MSVVGGAAGGEGGVAGCNDKNKNPMIECGEKQYFFFFKIYFFKNNLDIFKNNYIIFLKNKINIYFRISLYI